MSASILNIGPGRRSTRPQLGSQVTTPPSKMLERGKHMQWGGRGGIWGREECKHHEHWSWKAVHQAIARVPGHKTPVPDVGERQAYAEWCDGRGLWEGVVKASSTLVM